MKPSSGFLAATPLESAALAASHTAFRRTIRHQSIALDRAAVMPLETLHITGWISLHISPSET
jgi:hypothetical protein